MIQRLNTISWVMYVFYHFFLWVDRIKMVAPFLFWTIFFFSYFMLLVFFAQQLILFASWSLSIRYMYLYATVAAAAVFIRLYKSNRFLFFYYFLCATGWKRSVNVPSRNAPISLGFCISASGAQSAAQLLMAVE